MSQMNENQKPWRSLNEFSQSDAFEKSAKDEFTVNATEWQKNMDRRTFLKIMGAGLALSGLMACVSLPLETIVPYITQPEGIIPGKPLYFASATVLGGYALGILVESHEGRPTKIEGNPDHPASLGATDAFSQAAILDLYNPERSQIFSFHGIPAHPLEMVSRLNDALRAEEKNKGAGLRLLTQAVSSPTLIDQIQQMLKKFPNAKWYQYEPIHNDNEFTAIRYVFGQDASVQYNLEKADVIVSFDADFLECSPRTIRMVHDFAKRRQIESGAQINRLYAIESAPTNVGAVADHRFVMQASDVLKHALWLAQALGIDVPGLAQTENAPDWITNLAQDLKDHAGRSLILAGAMQPMQIHVLTFLMNERLGNFGNAIDLTEPILTATPPHLLALKELNDELERNQVSTLLIFGGNPAYASPFDFELANKIARVPFSLHLSTDYNETSEACAWHAPESHFLESWSDARAFDGTVSVIQPLIEPLYKTVSAHEILAEVTGQKERTSLEIVKAYWQKKQPSLDFEKQWRRFLHDGVIPNTRAKVLNLAIHSDLNNLSWPKPETGMELIFAPDPTLYDGRFAGNAWLQELPKPLSKLTWDNAAFLSPNTAHKWNVQNSDLVNLDFQGRSIPAPIWILPGQPDDSVTVTLGYGRTRAGTVGSDRGFNSYRLRSSQTPWFGKGLKITKTGKTYPLASTQEHWLMENRHLVRSSTLSRYKLHPDFAQKEETRPDEKESLYPQHHYKGNAWGMAINLNTCVGCNACVIACQSENNIPTVGKEQVLAGREMHWLRIDRYYEGNLENPEMHFQPVLCMHCETAPCEAVCPTNATVHSFEGLNDMVYNRCVGTRYCSNNCPYKVRRFNFLDYADFKTKSLKAMRNPDVTVRSRGVMEKCTYCVQRINHARIESENSGKPIRDGELKTACQQACPAQAIVFGNINDQNSAVTKLKASPLNYGLLESLNTRPRTSYLAKVKNPNPKLKGGNS